MTDVTTLLAGIKAHDECVAYADDIPEGGNEEVPEDYERHYCNEDGEDWPCPAARTDVPRLMAAIEAVEKLAERLRDNQPGDPDSAFDRGYAMGRRAAGDLVSNIIAAALGEGK